MDDPGRRTRFSNHGENPSHHGPHKQQSQRYYIKKRIANRSQNMHMECQIRPLTGTVGHDIINTQPAPHPGEGEAPMENSRRVYSTETGRICPNCGKPSGKCTCKKRNNRKGVPAFPANGVIRVQREVKGRKGKTVSTIRGLPLEDNALKLLARQLKQRCATGGAVKNGVIEIQGNHVDTLLTEIKKLGYAVKAAGG